MGEPTEVQQPQAVDDLAAETSAWLYMVEADEAVRAHRASKVQKAATFLMTCLLKTLTHSERSRNLKDAAKKFDISESHLYEARKRLALEVHWIDGNTTTVWHIPSFYCGNIKDPIVTTPVNWGKS
jgi:hypothetical protein